MWWCGSKPNAAEPYERCGCAEAEAEVEAEAAEEVDSRGCCSEAEAEAEVELQAASAKQKESAITNSAKESRERKLSPAPIFKPNQTRKNK